MCLIQLQKSLVIHCDTSNFKSITEACTLTIEHFVFSVIAGLLIEMLFKLLSIYNTVYEQKNK